MSNKKRYEEDIYRDRPPWPAGAEPGTAESNNSPKSVETVVLNLNEIDFESFTHTTPDMSVQREDTVFSTISLDVLYEKVSSPSKSVMPKSSDKKVIDDDRIKFYSNILKRPSFSTSDKYLSILWRHY